MRAVLQDACDRWIWERAVIGLPALALVESPLLLVPIKLAMQHTSCKHLARGALPSIFRGRGVHAVHAQP